jgi:nascent polypeptide-associated complex subunit alpha
MSREGKLKITELRKSVSTPVTTPIPKEDPKKEEPKVVVSTPKVDVQPVKPVEAKKEEPKPVVVEQPKPVEVKKEEPKPVEQPKPVEVKKEEVKPIVEQPKPVEVKKEEPKPVEIKKEEPKPIEVKKEEVKPVDVKPVEQPNEMKKVEEHKPVEVKKVETAPVDDDLPPLEESAPVVMPDHTEVSEVPPTSNQNEDDGANSRAEKKMKKSMEKLGLKLFPGVKEIHITTKNPAMKALFYSAEVFKCGDSFVIFGEPKWVDAKQAQNSQMQALQQQIQQLTRMQNKQQRSQKVADEAPVDESGVDAKDVELIMKQVDGITRSKAVDALKESGGDLVNAIMALTGV